MMQSTDDNDCQQILPQNMSIQELLGHDDVEILCMMQSTDDNDCRQFYQGALCLPTKSIKIHLY